MNKPLAILVAAVAIAGLAVQAAQAAPAADRPNENHYAEQLCPDRFHGWPIVLPSGLRPDCVTEHTVIEFDWAKSPKHYECIGQAIVYHDQTGKLPICVLLARDDAELQFAYAQRRAINRAGVALVVIDIRTLEARP